MSTIRRDASKGQMGNTLRVRFHMQVHAAESKGGGIGFTHGVRMLYQCHEYAFADLLEIVLDC